MTSYALSGPALKTPALKMALKTSALKMQSGPALNRLCGPAPKRRESSSLLAAADGRQGHLSRPAAPWGRGFPGPAPTHTTPHCTPVPLSAHSSPRAIRVRRSPR